MNNFLSSFCTTEDECEGLWFALVFIKSLSVRTKVGGGASWSGRCAPDADSLQQY